MIDVEEQLRFLIHRVKDCELDVVPLLRGSLSNWIWTIIGIPVR
jgi:isochorismate synthase/2-succinyl-5-enolpyruvyl-6-hydroxy-3-cyclohexene-1-carboxylate synthase/2-succinyl-6-hydroxy-2,4-cyclohexadiene-1-carboxylate synthase/O-succinylbenzoate synthase